MPGFEEREPIDEHGDLGAAVLWALTEILETANELQAIAGAVQELTFTESSPLRERVQDDLGPGQLPAVARRVAELGPWRQGPFPLGGGIVAGAGHRDDLAWKRLSEHIADPEGRRVLALRCGAGYGPFMFKLGGARDVLGCEPSQSIRQARFLESIYRTGVDFEQLDWPQLDPATHGRFDLIHCDGIVHRERNPMLLLDELRGLLSDDGELLLGALLHASSESSEYVRFSADSFADEDTWWFVPGRLAMRWMLEAAGFDVDELSLEEGPRRTYPTLHGYFRARPLPPARPALS